MEERVAPSAEDPHLQSSRPETTLTINETDKALSLQLAPPPNRPLETYVVQVPKDQIYRVPPPENARIVENYRKAAASPQRNKKRPCLHYLIWIAIALIVIGVLIGVALIILYHSFTPKAPVFSVSKLYVKQFKDGSPPRYDITLKVRNPNEKMGIQYGSFEDDAKLTFWTKTLGWGQFLTLYQNSGELNVFQVKLNGHEDQTVPPNVQRSMKDKKIKHQISLVLNVKSPLLLNVWILKLWKRDMDVKCNFRVSTMGEGTKILHQECKTNLS
ncbi:hypothetical protein PTKIN_Ptkin07bG0108000 [Pterospermum kingtungense]